jgi:hypothetical protein
VTPADRTLAADRLDSATLLQFLGDDREPGLRLCQAWTAKLSKALLARAMVLTPELRQLHPLVGGSRRSVTSPKVFAKLGQLQLQA